MIKGPEKCFTGWDMVFTTAGIAAYFLKDIIYISMKTLIFLLVIYVCWVYKGPASVKRSV